jgi:hypothetical protein
LTRALEGYESPVSVLKQIAGNFKNFSAVFGLSRFMA